MNEESVRVKFGFWSCFICIYDNDENMFYCDICGVFRFFLFKSGNDIDKKIGNVSFNNFFMFMFFLSGLFCCSICM